MGGEPQGMATSAPTTPRKAPAARKTTAPRDPLQELRDEAVGLERQLEDILWRDAIQAARDALQSLHDEESSGHPFDRRRGLRLRDKAVKVDSAFNRLRALRRGDVLPHRGEDEF